MSEQIPPGVFDILPNDEQHPWRNSHLWDYVETKIRETARDFGFQEIRTPAFERTELFVRSVGEGTDIVQKEMYTFEDKGGRSMTLRPEGTAPVMRCVMENHLDQQASVQKLFYISPMFRYERMQAGRYRQHHQFGVESIGYGSPEADAEVIDLLYTLSHRLGLKGLTVQLNSIGTSDTRSTFTEALKKYLQQHKNDLSEDSQRRLETNTLRILDSKDPKDQEIVANGPSILDFLDDEGREHFEKVQEHLDQIGVPYEINSNLVRGLDYYNRTVFEILAHELGAQNSIGGGGRYDGLLKQLGGPDLPAMGFGAGIERIIQTMLLQEVETPEPFHPTLFLIALGEKARKSCFSILHDLRQDGIPCQMDLSSRKLGKVMHYADHVKATFVAVIGENELESQIVELKRMSTGKTIQAPLDHLSRILSVESRSDEFFKIWEEMNRPFEHPTEAEFFINRLNEAINATKGVTHELQQAMDEMKDLL